MTCYKQNENKPETCPGNCKIHGDFKSLADTEKRYTPEEAYEEITKYAAYSIHNGDRIINNISETELKKILKKITKI